MKHEGGGVTYMAEFGVPNILERSLPVLIVCDLLEKKFSISSTSCPAIVDRLLAKFEIQNSFVSVLIFQRSFKEPPKSVSGLKHEFDWIDGVCIDVGTTVCKLGDC